MEYFGNAFYTLGEIGPLSDGGILVTCKHCNLSEFVVVSGDPTIADLMETFFNHWKEAGHDS
jgi:hypothetical protein